MWDHQRHRLPALSCRRVFPRDLPRDVPFWYHSTRAMPVATQECRPYRRSLQHWLVRTDLHTTPTACKAPSCRDHCFFFKLLQASLFDFLDVARGPRPAAACSLHRSFGVYRTTELLGFRALQALRGTDVDVDEPQSSEHPLPPPHT